MRREPIEKRKAPLAKLLKGSHLSLVLNEHYDDDGPRSVQAGLRGDRLEAAWLALSFGTISPLGESQKPESARAVKREAEEDWGR